MRNLTPKTIVIIWLLPIILLIGLLAYLGLNLGVDYTSANVISFQLAEPRSAQEVKEKLREIREFSRIDVFEEGRFYLYYQNVSLEDLSAMEEEIGSSLGELSDFQVFVYRPTTLVLITDRIVYALYATMVIYLVLIAYQLKNSGITREKLIWFLLAEFLIAVSVVVVLFGLLNMLVLVNIQITANLIVYALTILMFGLLLNIFLTRDLTFKTSSKLVPEVQDASDRFSHNYLQYYLLFGLLLSAILFADLRFVMLIVVCIAVIFYCVFLFLKLKPVLLAWLVANSKQHNPFSGRKFFTKEW